MRRIGYRAFARTEQSSHDSQLPQRVTHSGEYREHTPRQEHNGCPSANRPMISCKTSAELPGHVTPVIHTEDDTHLDTVQFEAVHKIRCSERDIHAIEKEKEHRQPDGPHNKKTESWH